MKQNKIAGFDFIRAFAIFFVFMAHIINKQCDNQIILLIERGISPGLTMSLLGFISGYLLTRKYQKSYDGRFYIKRFSRIYSSIFICLTTVVIMHIMLGYDVINQHSIIHYMGLSFFIELLQVENKSSIGSGLWFITIIIFMYLLLPIISYIYCHKNKIYHLLFVVVVCLFLNHVMYSTASAWNVIIAFNIGCYIGLSNNFDSLSKKPIYFYAIITTFLIVVSSLSSAGVIPYKIRNFLFPLYPILSVPLFYKIGNILDGFLKKIIIWFSGISYEVYIIHFYFINKNFSDLFPSITSLYVQIIIALIIVLPLSFILAKISSILSKSINRYMAY